MLLDRFVTLNGKLYKVDALDNVYEWVNHPGRSGLGELDGFFKKITRGVRKVVKKAIKIPIKVHKKVVRTVTKSKIGRQVLRVAGAVAAPFTGGLSLAAAEAAARYGKARYGQGLSRSQAFRKGAVGAVIGGATGFGISKAYGAFTATKGAAGYAGGGFTPAGYAGPGAVPVAGAAQVSFAPSVGNVISGAGGVLKTIGGTLATGLKTIGAALPVLQASGVLGPRGVEQAPSGEYYDSQAAAPAPFEGQYAGAGGGGGGFGPAGSPYEAETPEGALAIDPAKTPFILGGTAALAGLLLFTTMGPKPRGRSRRKGRR